MCRDVYNLARCRWCRSQAGVPEKVDTEFCNDFWEGNGRCKRDRREQDTREVWGLCSKYDCKVRTRDATKEVGGDVERANRHRVREVEAEERRRAYEREEEESRHARERKEERRRAHEQEAEERRHAHKREEERRSASEREEQCRRAREREEEHR